MTSENNTIEVSVARIGEEVRSVAVPVGATVDDVIRTAGIDARGFETRVGMGVVSGTTEVQAGDTLMLMPKIMGGGR